MWFHCIYFNAEIKPKKQQEYKHNYHNPSTAMLYDAKKHTGLSVTTIAKLFQKTCCKG